MAHYSLFIKAPQIFNFRFSSNSNVNISRLKCFQQPSAFFSSVATSESSNTLKESTTTTVPKTKSIRKPIRRLTRKEISEKLFNLPLEKLTPKWRNKIEGLKATQWHLRKKISTDSIPKTEKSKEKILVDPNIIAYIKEKELGYQKKRRVPKSKEVVKDDRFESPSDKLFKNHVKFAYAAKTFDSFPPETLPEIAFFGRSNVGKSSLLNALTDSAIARTSPKPGLTQTLNWFRLSAELFLVDFPGYGFAFVSESKKENWKELFEIYINQRRTLKRVILLIDARVSIKPSDIEMMEMFQKHKARFQVVLTKTDHLHPEDLARKYSQIQSQLKHYSAMIPRMLMVSSKTGAGISDLRKELSNLRIK